MRKSCLMRIFKILVNVSICNGIYLQFIRSALMLPEKSITDSQYFSVVIDSTDLGHNRASKMAIYRKNLFEFLSRVSSLKLLY